MSESSHHGKKIGLHSQDNSEYNENQKSRTDLSSEGENYQHDYSKANSEEQTNIGPDQPGHDQAVIFL